MDITTATTTATKTAIDFVVHFFCSCFCVEVNSICRLDKNLKDLVKDMGRLKEKRDDVLRWVERDEDAGLQRLSGVDGWLTAVENIENQAHETNTACARQGSSLCDVCSRKLVSRFRYGKDVFSMLKDVKELTDRKLTEDFHEVAQPPRRDVVEERDLEPIIIGHETILESAWSRLRDDGTLRMGLYGMGGVGKTTLLDQINNKFCGANDGVDIVIWVVVSKDKQNEKIQNEIADKLGFNESWKQKTESQKASDIRTSMKKKRFVLLLDDIWSKVELKYIGVPLPTIENKCKIVFTTRLREVCVHMGDTNPIEVSCLDTDKAWELFEKKVGKNTLGSHPDIPELARKVAAKCQGLPLALNVLGETMSSKETIQEWRHTVNKLASSAAEFSGMDDMILPILKFSYDSLKEKHVKQCFLYCSLFPEDFEIRKDRLIDYWICEGFIQEKQGIENAFDEGNAILSTLVRACLLLEESTSKENVKMHDVVREMALWVASDLGEHKGRYTVHAGVGLRELPEVENWGLVRKMSMMNNEIKELTDIPYCPQLTTLLLQKNNLVHFSGEFFQSMPNVVVLDLSYNNIIGLPEQISELVSLRYLDVSHTKIKKLPVGLQKLRKLIHLNLEWTLELESISGISKLWSLRTLRVQSSEISLDVNLVNELEILENLEVLTIEISSDLVAHKFLSSHKLVQCTKVVNFSRLHEPLTLPTTMGSLSGIWMDTCPMQEIKIVKTSAPWNKNPASPCFSSLCSVFISGCGGLKDLTWLLFAPNLTDLNVSFSDRLEDIINEEKALSNVTDDEAGIIIPFRKLEKLSLWSLPMLKSIYWNILRFPCLREVQLNECPNLTNLALNSQSVDRVEEFGITYRQKEWIENVEWEDEATQLRFLPNCKLVAY